MLARFYALFRLYGLKNVEEPSRYNSIQEFGV